MVHINEGQYSLGEVIESKRCRSGKDINPLLSHLHMCIYVCEQVRWESECSNKTWVKNHACCEYC